MFTKAKAAKLIRELVDRFLEMEATTGNEVKSFFLLIFTQGEEVASSIRSVFRWAYWVQRSTAIFPRSHMTCRISCCVCCSCVSSLSCDIMCLLQVTLCQQSIEWAKGENRVFLRQSLEARLVALYVDTHSYTSALAIGKQ